jgi:hypothetical protein
MNDTQFWILIMNTDFFILQIELKLTMIEYVMIKIDSILYNQKLVFLHATWKYR